MMAYTYRPSCTARLASWRVAMLTGSRVPSPDPTGIGVTARDPARFSVFCAACFLVVLVGVFGGLILIHQQSSSGAKKLLDIDGLEQHLDVLIFRAVSRLYTGISSQNDRGHIRSAHTSCFYHFKAGMLLFQRKITQDQV